MLKEDKEQMDQEDGANDIFKHTYVDIPEEEKPTAQL